MSNINKLLEVIKNNEYVKSFKPTNADVFDLLGGSMRSINKNTDKNYTHRDPMYKFLSKFADDKDNYSSLISSVEMMDDPINRILSKPGRIGLDIKELLTDPKWSLKNNKIGLTKDAIILNLLLGNNEETDINEELNNYE